METFLTTSFYGLFIIAAILFILSETVFALRNDETGVVHRFGKINRATCPGLHFKIPFIEKVYSTDVRGFYCQKMDCRAQSRDNKEVIVRGHLIYRASYDGVLNTEKIGSHADFSQLDSYYLRSLVVDDLASAFSSYDLSDIPAHKDEIIAQAQKSVSEELLSRGFEVSEFNLELEQ